jgi:hypothetical protein
MKNFEIFTFESYRFNEKTLKAYFYYSFNHGEELFEEIIDFKQQSIDTCGYSQTTVNNFLFQLHLAL